MKKFIIAVLGIFLLVFSLVYFHIYDDKDTCLDVGLCKEGLIINTEKGQITVNEQTCKNENGTWDDKKRFCRF